MTFFYLQVPQQPPDVQIQKQNTEDLAFNMVLTKKEESSGSGLASLTGYGSADEPEEEGKKNLVKSSTTT